VPEGQWLARAQQASNVQERFFRSSIPMGLRVHPAGCPAAKRWRIPPPRLELA
jgi:hypothetical protein